MAARPRQPRRAARRPARRSRRRASRRVAPRGVAARGAAPLVAIAATLMLVVGPTLLEGARAHAAARTPLTLGADGVVLQRHPQGCGAALLATLLARRGLPGDEAELLAAAPPGPNGISLATFAELARRHGLKGVWRRARDGSLPPPGFVAHLDRPAGHFVWVADRAGDYLLVVDPATGEAVWHVERFARRWSGRYLRLEARS